MKATLTIADIATLIGLDLLEVAAYLLRNDIEFQRTYTAEELIKVHTMIFIEYGKNYKNHAKTKAQILKKFHERGLDWEFIYSNMYAFFSLSIPEMKALYNLLKATQEYYKVQNRKLDHRLKKKCFMSIVDTISKEYRGF